MRRIVGLSLALLASTALWSWGAACQPIRADACFRPGPVSCAQIAIDEIAAATTAIDFAAYQLTDTRIVDALNQAALRGVTVHSVVDRDATLAHLLPGEVRTDCAVAIMHNKILIIDHATVLTGSYNWTNAAAHRNAENLVRLRDPVIAAAFEANFANLIAASVRGVDCPNEVPHDPRRQ